eukprot:TRINITY_DN2206_c0_g1_i1.p1 TRINITY_DN2206_c0_g1~~TRINITY_DN2206_c0_g1_i1.p1  ORF type:complete len:142 (-),score=16.39 TRINITY_DN2206_c0_g1_i1:942-1367(-)
MASVEVRKVIAITGGSRGIGKSLVQNFCRNGYRVSYCDILPRFDDGKDKDLFYQSCDVSNEGQVKSWIEETVARFSRIDCLINNAAVVNPYNPQGRGPLDVDHWLRVVSINLTGPFLCAKYTAPFLQQHPGSRYETTPNCT